MGLGCLVDMTLLGAAVLLLSAVAAVTNDSPRRQNHGKDKRRAKPTVDMTIHSTHNYDSDYLHSYRYMFNSLTQGAFGIDRSMQRSSGDHRNSNNLYGHYSNSIPQCRKIGLTNMKLLKVLQDETNSYVMLKQDTKTGKLYVEKSTTRENSFDKETEFFKVADKKDPYFAKFSCYSVEKKGHEMRYSIVTEYFNGRDSHLLAQRASLSQLQSMVAQLFNSIIKLHRIGYVHADIKPGNVLASDDFKIQLIDFGMVERISEARKYRGSPYTRAPELHDMSPGPVNEGIDWWAFGATVAIWAYYQCQVGHHKGLDREEAVDFLQRAIANFKITSQYDFTPMKWGGGRFHAQSIPSCFTPQMRSFLALFLTIDSELREFNTEQLQAKVRAHQFFAGFDWNSI